jgi:hypothetical protein
MAYNISVVHPAENSAVEEDVVVVFFTNGVKQGSEKLWVDRSRLHYWPSKWLPANLAPLKCRVVEVEYYIDTWDWKCLFPLLDQSTNIIFQLEGLLACAKHKRPIILISHGFGGFLVKQIIVMLKHSGERFKDFFQCVAGAVFFSCPHKTRFSYQLREILEQLVLPSTSVHLLKMSAPYFLTLSEELCKIDHIACISFGEGQKLTSQELVPIKCSRLGKGDFCILGIFVFSFYNFYH